MGCTNSVASNPQRKKNKKNKVPKFLQERDPEYNIRKNICSITQKFKENQQNNHLSSVITSNTIQFSNQRKITPQPINIPIIQPTSKSDNLDFFNIQHQQYQQQDHQFSTKQLNSLLMAQQNIDNQDHLNKKGQIKTVIVNDHIAKQSVQVPILPKSLGSSTIFKKRLDWYYTQIHQQNENINNNNNIEYDDEIMDTVSQQKL